MSIEFAPCEGAADYRVVDNGLVGYGYDAGEGRIWWPTYTKAEAAANASGRETPAERQRRIDGNRNHCFNRDFLTLKGACRFEATLPELDPVALAECKAFAEGFEPRRGQRDGLWMFGPHSRGKTWLAGCICNELTDRGIRCRMTTVQTLADDVRERHGSAGEVLAGLRKDDLVVLDDLFRDSNTPTVADIRNRIIDFLANSPVAVVATCNLTREAVGGRCAEGNRKAIEQMKVKCRTLEFPADAPNLRQIKAVM